MLDAFDKRSATEGGSGSVIVVIGERNLRTSQSCGPGLMRNNTVTTGTFCTAKLSIDNAILPCFLLVLFSQ